MGLLDFLKSDQKPLQIPQYEDPFDLRTPLFGFSNFDLWTIADAVEGTQIFGATGSGKTSGSGQTIAKAFLARGFGGLVLTAKSDERETWEKYCSEVGCLDSLIVISPTSGFKFNFLDYELNRGGSGAGLTENLVNLFYTVMEVSEGGKAQKGGDSYWERTLKQLLRNTIDLLIIAKGTLSLLDIYEVIISAPRSYEEMNNENWQQNSFCFQLIEEGEVASKTHSQKLDFEYTAKYWLTEFVGLAEKTRSIIVSSFTSMADTFLRGTLRDMFCTETNYVPELSQEGVIILLDLPVKEFGELGKYAQVLFKYIWQQATERRNVRENNRPVFLWADESQFFISDYDQKFQTTARSSRACTVYLTQNLPNYLTALGGRDMVDSFLGNLQTKVFHSQGDHVTNQWASELFAKTWQTRTSRNSSTSTDGKFFAKKTGTNISLNTSESLEYQVLPHNFTTLRKGGHHNNLEVDGIIFQGGRTWVKTNTNFLLTTFKQG